MEWQDLSKKIVWKLWHKVGIAHRVTIQNGHGLPLIDPVMINITFKYWPLKSLELHKSMHIAICG